MGHNTSARVVASVENTMDHKVHILWTESKKPVTVVKPGVYTVNTLEEA